jgi:hypothetical protein
MPLVDSLEFFGSVPIPYQIQGFLRGDFDLVPVLSEEDRVVLDASGFGRFEVFGPYEFRIASGIQDFSVNPLNGAYDFRRTALVQEDGITP